MAWRSCSVGAALVVLALWLSDTALGLVALVAGIWAIVAASETMLVVLVGAMVILWLMATVRHLVGASPRQHIVGSTPHAV